MPIKVFTYYKALKQFKETPKTKVYKRASLLAEFDLTIYHRKGKEMIPAD